MMNRINRTNTMEKPVKKADKAGEMVFSPRVCRNSTPAWSSPSWAPCIMVCCLRGILYNIKLGSIDSAAITNLRKIKVVADICWRATLMNRKLPPQKAVTIIMYKMAIIGL